MTAAQQEPAGYASVARYADPPIQTVMGLYLAEMRQVVKLAQEESAKLEGALIRGREAGQRLVYATWPEERAYLQAAISFGQLAREQLIHAYLQVPIALAKRLRRDDVELLDLVQEGNLALIDAIDSYEPAPDVSLFLYVCRQVRRAMRRLLDSSDLIPQPAHMTRYCQRISAAVPVLQDRLGRQPKMAEIAAEIGMSEQMVRLTLVTVRPIRLFSEPLGASTRLVLGDVVAAADGTEDATDTTEIRDALLASVRAALCTLTPLQRQVVDLRLGLEGQEPKGFQVVSECLGYHDKRTSWNVYHGAIDQVRRQLLSPADYAALTTNTTTIAARNNTAVLRRSKRKRSKAVLTIRKNHYEALGRPERVRVQADDDGLQIVPDPEGRYPVEHCARHIQVPLNSLARRRGMRAGRYEAQVVDGGLRIGAYLG